MNGMMLLGLVALSCFLSAVIGYLLGSINWSIILTRIFKQKEDIRKFGSGNAGMTNVLRTVGKLPAALTFLGDFIKCVVAVLLAWAVASLVSWCSGVPFPWECVRVAQYIAGIACVFGHIFPVFYGFRGGKGVVTSAAMIALLDWRAFLLVIITFIILFLAKRIISLASVVGAALYPIYACATVFLFDYRGSPLQNHGDYSLFYVIFVTAVAVFIGGTVIIKHRSNIGRLIRGEEKPVSLGGKK